MLGLFIVLLIQTCPYSVDASLHVIASTNIDLTIHLDNGTVLTFNDLEGENVLDITESVVEVETQWTGGLVFVTSIAGVENSPNDGLWWQYWVNDELGSVAANLYHLQDGDKVSWKILPPEQTTEDGQALGGQIDNSLVLGIGVTSFIGVGFLFIVYLRLKW